MRLESLGVPQVMRKKYYKYQNFPQDGNPGLTPTYKNDLRFSAFKMDVGRK